MVVCELLLPLLIVGRDPERVLELLLPSFAPVAAVLGPMTRWIATVGGQRRSVERPRSRRPTRAAEEANEAAKAYIDTAEQEGIIEGEERRLLQSIVDFGDTLVREVMTPRPDIVAIREDATIGDLRALFREQEYSRFPVFKDSLDNIAGFVFVKDLVALDAQRRRPADHAAAAAGGGRAGDQARARAAEAVPAAADADRDRRRRVRRHGRARDDRGPARGDRRRDSRRVRRRVRADRRRRQRPVRRSAARWTSTRSRSG